MPPGSIGSLTSSRQFLYDVNQLQPPPARTAPTVRDALDLSGASLLRVRSSFRHTAISSAAAPSH